MARLTIAVPAYNNSNTLRASVESLLAQSFGDFKLIISDDNSPDETPFVAMELARFDRRIEYVCQQRNLKYQNFGYLLRRADTEFFMWAAGDDYWHPDYARRCIAELDADASLVLVTSQIAFERDGVLARLSDGTFPLVGTTDVNIHRYLLAPGDNSRMYGVFRTKEGQRSFPVTSFHAYDWAFCAATLRFGGHGEIPEVLMVRDLTPSANYQTLASVDGRMLMTRLLPLFEMSYWLLAEAKIPLTRGILGALVALNINKHIDYINHFYPKFAKIVSPLVAMWRRFFEWRLLK